MKMPNSGPLGTRKLIKQDVRIIGLEVSGDGETWHPFSDSAFVSSGAGGFTSMVDLMANGERVFVRTKYCDRHLQQRHQIYELKLEVIQPIRQLLETTAAAVASLPAAPPAAGDPPADPPPAADPLKRFDL